MPKNKVQFQRGMSLREFMTQYGTREQCEQALFKWRWPRGFACPECGDTAYCALKSRRLFQCSRCRRQTSVSVGTVFAGSKLALTTWFLAMYLVTQAKNGISSLELARQLGVSQNSAWLLKQKLMQTMLKGERARRLTGLVQIDDAYWGGRRRGYKRGRGSRGKTPFVVTASKVSASGRSRAGAGRLAEGSAVHSDMLACFRAFEQAGCRHTPILMSGPGAAHRRKALNWVDTMLGNVKNAIHGTYHAIRPKHLPRYLAQFAYRFNRRLDLANLLPRLAVAGAQTPPMPYRLVKLAEAHW